MVAALSLSWIVAYNILLHYCLEVHYVVIIPYGLHSRFSYSLQIWSHYHQMFWVWMLLNLRHLPSINSRVNCTCIWTNFFMRGHWSHWMNRHDSFLLHFQNCIFHNCLLTWNCHPHFHLYKSYCVLHRRCCWNLCYLCATFNLTTNPY